MAKNEEMFSMSYEDAKNKYGTGLGNNKMFMPKEMFNKKQAELNKNKPTKQEEKPKNTSLVADKFGNKKNKTWNDVKAENGNDPEKIKDYLNNNPSYKAGNLTKKGMEEFGYAQGEDGKWSIKQPTTDTTTEDTTTVEDTTTEDTTTTKPTTVKTTPYTGTTTTTTDTTKTDTIEEINKKLQELYNQNKDLQNQLKQFQDKEGNFNEKKTIDAMAQYEQKMAEMGAGKFDKDGKFILKDTTKKGWEDYATMLSAGLSVIGLAMGIPIIPINFRKITNKDEKDAKVREFQKQYTDIFANSAAKVEDVKSSAKAGKIAKENEEDIKSYSKYKEDVDAYEAKSNIDTDSEKDLIETRTNAQIKADEARFNNEMKRIKNDQNFQINIEALRDQYKERFAALESALMTGSTKELLKYQNGEMFKEMEKMGITPSKLATWKAAQASISPADKAFNKINTGVNAVANLAGTIFGKGNNGGKD